MQTRRGSFSSFWILATSILGGCIFCCSVLTSGVSILFVWAQAPRRCGSHPALSFQLRSVSNILIYLWWPATISTLARRILIFCLYYLKRAKSYFIVMQLLILSATPWPFTLKQTQWHHQACRYIKKGSSQVYFKVVQTKVNITLSVSETQMFTEVTYRHMANFSEAFILQQEGLGLNRSVSLL